MIRWLCVLGLLGTFCLSGAAAEAGKAKGTKHDAEAVFKKLDSDKDGQVSLEEFKKMFSDPEIKAPARLKDDPEAQEKLFKKYDSNNDGNLSLEEFKKLWAHLHKKDAGKEPKPD